MREKDLEDGDMGGEWAKGVDACTQALTMIQSVGLAKFQKGNYEVDCLGDAAVGFRFAESASGHYFRVPEGVTSEAFAGVVKTLLSILCPAPAAGKGKGGRYLP